jgi:hypothetical protein
LIEQALYGPTPDGGRGLLARSPGFSDAWLPDVEQLYAGFGERPDAAACPGCLFVQPWPGKLVVVVQAADAEGLGLLFRLLVLPRGRYADLGGDPFHLCEHCPPDWQARGDLPAFAEPPPPPPRTVDAVRAVLDVPQSATLLGGVQALLDGGKLAFERNAPDERLVRSLWALLPPASRAELWPATFAFGNALGFHVVVTPRADGPDYAGYVHEEQAGDYPEGTYEKALQIAAEDSDQATLDRLFSRRSRGQTLKLAIALVLIFLLAPVLVSLFLGPLSSPPPPTTPAAGTEPQEKQP